MFEGIEPEKIEVIYQPKKLKAGSDIERILLVYLKNKDKQAVNDVINKLRANPCVISAEPDYYIDMHVIPNDRYYNYLWGLQRIRAPLAWDYTTGNSDVIVAVLDSGIDYNHPDIRNNLWVALDEEGFSNNPFDFTGHGTHVAGTIGAQGNNFIGVTGVCWNVRIASLKIGNDFISLAAAIRAVNFASENNIPIINSSWGGRLYSSALKFAIDNYDGLIVASAGNDGTNNDVFPMYPASFNSSNILSVASTSPNNNLSFFSNFGARSVDIAAPGMRILSTDINNTYSYLSGTSMAAPHVAGAAALLKGYRPNLTTLQIKNILLASVDRVPNLIGRVLTGGILNLQKMITIANTQF